MKGVLFYLSFILMGVFCFAKPAICQDQGWQWLNPLPRMHAIDFVDSLNGWVVGSSGTVIRTTDGGQTWELLSTGRDDAFLLAVDFINNQEGWVAGALPNVNGIIMHTEDGGQNWEVQHVETRGDFHAIKFIDKKYGLAGGQLRLLMYTTDGGISWQQGQADISPVAYVISISYIDSLNAWAEGTSMPLLHTNNGGRTWIADTVAIAGKKVFFADFLHGWVMRGDGGVWRTVDGGKNWSAYPEPMAPGWQFIDVFFADTLVGYITNEIGTYRSNDGGITWQMVSDEWAEAIFFTSRNFGWGVNVSNGAAKRLAYTSDGGRTWNAALITAVEHTPNIGLSPASFILYPNYPNPFNPETKIQFQLLQPNTHVRLIIFNILGKEVVTLVDEILPIGKYERLWDGKDSNGKVVPSGVYFYQLSSKDFKYTRKMLLLQTDQI